MTGTIISIGYQGLLVLLIGLARRTESAFTDIRTTAGSAWLKVSTHQQRARRCFSATRDDSRNESYARNLSGSINDVSMDPLWSKIKLEATLALEMEPEAGPQLYQSILSQPNLLTACVTIISHEIETELIPATALKALFLDLLTNNDVARIRLDLEAVADRKPISAMSAMLFDNGFHALVCYRVSHRLYRVGRTALAYYMQSTVSRHYSADIHPACVLGGGTYLRVCGGVVIGETAVIGRDCSILEGVTLGGTGKQAGDRHPKVGDGVIIHPGGSILGNIPIGDGAIVESKSIVTKPIPPLAIVSGVPATIRGYRSLDAAAFEDDLQHHLVTKYLDAWRKIAADQNSSI
jgi:serine O-acetyltransferase